MKEKMWRDWFSFLVLLVLLNLQSFHKHAGGLPVKFLPGYDGPLPFQLETGYIGVGQNEEIQLFYYFIKSDSNPQEDPLILWITGGQTCSGFRSILQQIGPLLIEPYNNGSMPCRLLPFPHSWTKVASFIFLDLSVGAGFSYATTSESLQSDDLLASSNAYEFIQKGYILGSPNAFPTQNNYRIPFAHGMGLISNQLYESLKENCKGNYINVDPTNLPCQQDLQTFNQLIERINLEHILEPVCMSNSTMSSLIMLPGQKSLYDNLYPKLKIDPYLLSGLQCRNEWPKLSEYWANDYRVQMALHVRKGTKEKWQLCSTDSPYAMIVDDIIPYHAKLSKKGYRSLIFSGDHELICPYMSTEAWIKSLNYSVIDDWKPWMVEDQVAGYTMTYANRMTYATIKGGGHVAPDYRPFESQIMFKRWISYENL